MDGMDGDARMLKLEYLPVSKLRPYERNARKHDKASIEAIAASIAEFGFDDPVGIWGDNFIVEGHGRVQAAKKLGIKEVPCVRLDHLTDEQRRAYALAHNKTAEVSDWDYDLLDLEINDLDAFDFDGFGFDLVDAELEHEKAAQKTQALVENILDLGRGSFAGVGKYDIPQLAPVTQLPEIREWIGFNYVLSDKDPSGKAVHFFVDDYQFERLWRNPEKYVDKLRQYACVATPDFSPYADMPLVLQLYNHYRKHWVGAYLQANGVTVIPTIRASQDERAWNAGEVDVLLAHPSSCAYGLNLQQGGHHIVWYEYPNWTLELYQQATARLYRQGQKLPVIVHHLVVQDSMDEAVVAALHDKGDAQAAIMEALKAKVRRAKGVREQ